MLFKQIIERIEFSPKKIFLIDGLGAILSSFLLGVVLVKLENVFGIPSSTLYFLATLPIFFAIFDFYCYLIDDNKLGHYLNVIATVNLLYCCLSIRFAFNHFGTITNFGWAYILIEVLIIIFLAILELKAAKRLISQNINN